MARIAHARDTYLTPDEIAREALRQFDAGGREPTIRGLAARLRVAPTAIYHHFPSRESIVEAAVELVWAEAATIGAQLVGDLRTATPQDVLLAAGLATRRAFARHPRLAASLVSGRASERMAGNLTVVAGAFERLGLHGEAAAEAFHVYASFTIGSVLVLAARLALAEEAPPASTAARVGDAPTTREVLEATTWLSVVDPEHDEELFVSGLRRIVATFAGA